MMKLRIANRFPAGKMSVFMVSLATAVMALSLALSMAGCLEDTGGGGKICTQVFVYGLTVKVTDSETGAALEDVTVSAVDSDGIAQAAFETGTEAGAYTGLGEKIGTFDVSVSKTGYAPQTFSVDLASDGCHVIPQSREIALVPSG